jgi:hypothetical protein
MAGILYRAIRYEIKKEGGRTRYRRFPWNLVNTSQGAGWEPVSFPHHMAGIDTEAANSGNSEKYDDNDEILRVDEIFFDGDLHNPFHYDKGSKCMGGHVVLDRVIPIT